DCRRDSPESTRETGQCSAQCWGRSNPQCGTAYGVPCGSHGCAAFRRRRGGVALRRPFCRRNGAAVPMRVETFTPHDVMRPIGPYSHIAKAGPLVWISGTAGVDPATGQLAGPDACSQARQILRSVRTLLAGIGAGMEQVTHVQVFLKRMDDFEAMN